MWLRYFYALSALSLALVAFSTSGSPAGGEKLRSREFQFTYTAEVNSIPEDARRVDIWLPYPPNDSSQHISDVQILAPYKTSLRRDPEYGNLILYMGVDKPAASIKISMKFKVKRKEHVRNDFKALKASEPDDPDPPLKRFLLPDKLVPIDAKVREWASAVTEGKRTELEKAKAIYEHTVSTLKYDKSGSGWGRGDLYYACDVKRGNCSDFHAVFIGFCRAVGIPAKFEIGFPLPEARGSGQISGYHCWAKFYLKGYGWVPVDCSEANKNPARKDYFFGAIDENRVLFSEGRDILLDPPQKGERLNFFIYPYVEVDGKPFDEVKKEFLFKDLSGAAG